MQLPCNELIKLQEEEKDEAVLSEAPRPELMNPYFIMSVEVCVRAFCTCIFL